MIAYLSMAAIAVLAAAWMSRPFWRRGSEALLRRRAANVAVYRTRLAELEAEVEAQLIEPATAQQIRDELGARLVQDADLPAEGAAPATATRRWPAVGLLMLLLLGFSALGYWQQGSWRTQQMIETAQRDPQAGQQLAIEDMIQRLAERLQQQPDDDGAVHKNVQNQQKNPVQHQHGLPLRDSVLGSLQQPQPQGWGAQQLWVHDRLHLSVKSFNL